jgi:hypothetical protein
MPAAQQMVEKANQAWNSDNLHKLKPAHFKSTRTMKSHRNEHVAKNRAQKDIADGFPEGLHEMLRALYVHNLERETPLAIQHVWMPGYDWELQVAECPGTSVSPGGITVIIRGRYPLDTHPSTLKYKKKTTKKKAAKKKTAKKAAKRK